MHGIDACERCGGRLDGPNRCDACNRKASAIMACQAAIKPERQAEHTPRPGDVYKKRCGELWDTLKAAEKERDGLRSAISDMYIVVFPLINPEGKSIDDMLSRIKEWRTNAGITISVRAMLFPVDERPNEREIMARVAELQTTEQRYAALVKKLKSLMKTWDENSYLLRAVKPEHEAAYQQALCCAKEVKAVLETHNPPETPGESEGSE